jgi:hypothetical protein
MVISDQCVLNDFARFLSSGAGFVRTTGIYYGALSLLSGWKVARPSLAAPSTRTGTMHCSIPELYGNTVSEKSDSKYTVQYKVSKIRSNETRIRHTV